MSLIQQIFRDHGAAYIDAQGAGVAQGHRQAIRAIQDCRSGACGHHIFTCGDCGRPHVTNSSCGNRHCPVCQHEKNASWVYRQQLKRLPCDYFMVTFTLPEELRTTAQANAKAVYAALFDCAADSLRTLEADRRFVGCKISGFFGVLHTWGRQLQYHPHVHFVVPGGGLSADRDKWIASRGNFLVHVRTLSRMFRGKMKARLKQADLLQAVPAMAWDKEWNVNCQCVGDGERTITYLGAYVFRVAISDARITAYDGLNVSFKYQKVGASRWRYMTLTAMEFMRRYLAHVLPRGFVKVRHYGFMAPNFAIPLQRIRELICMLYETLRHGLPKMAPPRKPKPLRCPECDALMRWVKFIPPSRMPVMT